jgi:hypothetical protein
MKYPFAVIFFFYSSLSFASLNTDSLKMAVRQQKDSTLTDTYIQLARYYFQIEHLPYSMIKYSQLTTTIGIRFRFERHFISLS